MAGIVGIHLDDLTPGSEAYVDNGNTGAQTPAAPYKIAPILWVLGFLIMGYVGVRLLIED